MNTFGGYLRGLRESKGLPLRKVAAQLDIDTSILSKIERNERKATISMLPIWAKVFETEEKEIQTKFIYYTITSEYGDLNYLKDGLNEILKTL